MLGILHDVSRCTGCLECVEACNRANGQPHDVSTDRRSRDGLSAGRFITLVDAGAGHTMRRHCLHCLEPACASACLVGALRRTAKGRVVYDAGRCIGCRYCMLACPFEIPRYEWDARVPRMRKCEMCKDRPGGPACVAACRHGATMFGERDELLRVARERIAAQPDVYVDHVWGEHEAGGTAVLYVSDVSLDAFWPAGLGDRSIPARTEPLMSMTPWMALAVGGSVSAVSWVVHRRMKRQAEAAAEENR